MNKLLLILICFLGYFPLQGQDSLRALKNTAELFSYCSDKKFIVFGEAHGIEVINDIRLESIKHLLKQGRKTHLLLEMGVSSEKAFNDFIFSDKKLNPFLRFPKNFMDSLKVLASHYPDQLTIHGVDVETSLSLYIEHLQQLKEFILEEPLKNSISNLVPQKVLSKKEKKRKRKQLKQIINACAAYFDKAPVKDSLALNLIKKGKESFLFADKGLMKGAYFRDQLMYENIQQILRSFPNDFFYMQIGLHHAYSYTDKANWKGGLTEMLNTNPSSLVYQKVFSIGQGVVKCASTRTENVYTELENFPLQLNPEVISYFKKEKEEFPVCYIWQPKEMNNFNLYLITIGYSKEEKEVLKNNLHLIY